MKIYNAANIILLLPALASAAICNNNCGRQVAGTARASPPLASRSSLCADFVTTYVTGSPQPVSGRNVHVRRQDSPGPIITGTKPAYASSCPDVTAYWSACQCIEGIEATTITVPFSQPTISISASVTSSVPSSSEESVISSTEEPSSSSITIIDPSSSEASPSSTEMSSSTSDLASTTTSEPSSSITSVSEPSDSPSSTAESSTTAGSSSTASFPLCTPGLEFAIYAIEPDTELCETIYSSPSRTLNLYELLQERIPDATGLTPSSGRIGFRQGGAAADSPAQYYGVSGRANSTFECNIIHHRGYLEVTSPGAYSVIPETPDDVILMWVGDNAKSGAFRAGNSNISGRCCGTPASYRFEVEPFDGLFTYIPFRIFYANSGGPGGFGVRVAAATGNQLPQNTTDPFLVANCTGEGNPAPGWAAWQEEEVGSTGGGRL